jgi:hypothetical protein
VDGEHLGGERCIRAKVQMPDATTLAKIEHVADRLLAADPFTVKDPKPEGYAYTNHAGEIMPAITYYEGDFGAFLSLHTGDSCFIEYFLEEDRDGTVAIFRLSEEEATIIFASASRSRFTSRMS